MSNWTCESLDLSENCVTFERFRILLGGYFREREREMRHAFCGRFGGLCETVLEDAKSWPRTSQGIYLGFIGMISKSGFPW